MKWALACVAGLCLVLPAPAAGAPPDRPDPRAGSAIVIDGGSGEVLFERGADRRSAIASATKLMTALLTLERAPLDAVFTAPPYQALAVESKIDLQAGERMRVRDLLRALLLESANDAAVTLAENISGSRPAFVRDMNRRARRLGLGDTRYANPIGLDHPANYSTARDLAVLARTLMRDPRFARIVDLPRAELRSGARRRVVDNRNLLVRREPFVDGVKTGYTRQAGYVLVGAASGRGARVVSVVLDEPSAVARDSDSLELLRFGIDSFRRTAAIRTGRALARVPIAYNDGARATLVPARTLAVTVRRGESVRRRVRAPRELEGPLPAGARVGSVAAVYRGRVVGTVALLSERAVPGPSRLRRAASALGLPVLSLFVLLAGTLIGLRLRAVRLGRPPARR